VAGYCTLDDLKKKVPEETIVELTDDAGTGAIDQGQVDEAIEAASDEIDLYIGKVAKLPIAQDQIPPMLRSLAAELAVYHLYSRKQRELPEVRKDRYKNAVRLLEKVLDGKISIGLEPPPEAPPNRDVKVAVRTQIFDEETLDKF
jgi:phage gp36-like protein